jgi:PadR family transcriptional regulator AphA
MPARRSTPYVILGLLRIAPMSGYGIRKELSSSTGYFWSESYGQIYPALHDLKSRGWARPRLGRHPEGKRGRHTYAITAKGREAFDRWLREPPRSSPSRNELLLKLFLSDREFLDPPEAWIRHLLAEETERLQKLRRLQDQLPRGKHRHPNLRFWLFSLEHVERQAEAAVAWCLKTLAAIALLQQAQTRRRAAAHRRLLFE